MEKFSIDIMNTNFYIEISNSEQKNWKEEITALLTYVEREWSRFRDDNELAILNKSEKGMVIPLSAELYDVLMLADFYFKKTNGLFSPYLKKDMEQNGYIKSFPFSEISLEQLIKSSDENRLEENPFIFLKNHKVYKNTSQEVDLGGFAKGYVVQSIAKWLKNNGETEYGLVDGGGDMTMWSNGEKRWIIGIADPFREDKIVTSILMKNGAVATSNRLYRSWHCENERKHHLLNGRTGKPAITNVVQATAVTGHLLDGEVLAKMCFLIPEQERNTWIKETFPYSYYYLVKEKEEKGVKGQ